MKRLSFVVILFAALLLAACNGTSIPLPDNNGGEVRATEIPDESGNEAQPTSDRWAGSAFDGSSLPVGDVSIVINEVAVQSDGNGNFEAMVPRAADNRYVINAQKAGYLPISQIHIGSALEQLRLDFKPVETFTVDPTAPIAVADSKGTEISIAPNQLVDSNGNPATEELTLNMYTYDLAEEPIVGDMSGTSTDGAPVFMESAGAFYADFTDDAGNDYNLAEGGTAEVSIPCKPRADEVLTIWWYDPMIGLWIEEALPVTQAEDTCTGVVNHFSYWNFDWEKSNPACIKLAVEQSYLAANSPLNVRAVLQTSPVQVRDLVVTEQVNVLINLPADTNVQFFTPFDATTPFNTINSGQPWGGTGVPAFPYDACKGLANIAPPPTPTAATTLMGQVTDAVSGSPIAGAQVCIQSTSLCATTDETGTYTIPDAPAGEQILNVTATGYIPVADQAVTIVSGTDTSQLVALSQELPEGELRIVLTWGAQPSDLDSYLLLPSGTGVYHNNKGPVEGAELDLDDQDGNGPETITIQQQSSGRYVYAVDRYSATPSITTSEAVVRVYRGNSEIASFEVPTTGDGRWWHVFDLDGATGTITPVNTLSESQPQ